MRSLCLPPCYNRLLDVTLQGDVSTTLQFGATLLTQNTNDNANKVDWFNHNYLMNGNGFSETRLSAAAGNSNTATVFVRALRFPWVYAGTLSQYTSIRSTYPMTMYELGSPYNGPIQPAFYNSWNIGGRISLSPIYPMGDTAVSP
jgi:hypothetical protein